ncbi:Pantothenate kinase [Candidatus Arsenophonus lipoptenae]|uniref:Pantothenate kinase n=1 Tax=Candidatus Arsenophonus lipoptenae TaxID=634113 RepID=A0A0X9VV21_9GAMM|nr:type I pantothenate kinase [Candidatus Arsenophonus lipoptenae]AMA64938.1 Pantothenate kinase [Candidatus Arsenophonus lipoptenae]
MKKLKKITITPYLKFTRKRWKYLSKSIPLELIRNKDISKFKKIDDEISINEINKIYIPISKLINFYVNANLSRQIVLEQFLGTNNIKIPYVIGITGGVAVGKSTTASLLKILLSNLSKHRKVEIITTDGFLYSNQILNERKLMQKKGFPQSYDMYSLEKFISDIKSGVKKVTAPVYSHITYDIIPNKKRIIIQPDILILEGLNILQNGIDYQNSNNHFFISDFIDFSIYVDAPKNLLKKWYINRFLKFCRSALSNPHAYFYHYSQLNQKKIIKIAQKIWNKINKINLEENIIPTKKRANLIITKGYNHSITQIQLRK